jgi:riboflavin synthase
VFTGIIESTGVVKSAENGRLFVECPAMADQLKVGGSIAVDGACLTATQVEDSGFFADFMPETATRTVMGRYHEGTLVNLELPLRADGRLEGHIVTGHVEGPAELVSIEKEGNSFRLTFRVPGELARFIVEKGSVALNGISLTVASAGTLEGVSGTTLSVCVIPHTWEVTNLRHLQPGDKVNLETDILAKHLARLSVHD